MKKTTDLLQFLTGVFFDIVQKINVHLVKWALVAFPISLCQALIWIQGLTLLSWFSIRLQNKANYSQAVE